MKKLKDLKIFRESREKTGDLDKRLQDQFDKINERLMPSWERLKQAKDKCVTSNPEPKPVA